MARTSKGYVELYWSCPNCGGENLGSASFCVACGSPQPQDVEFHQALQGELITDEEKLKRAKAGADIHCGFCGTRNPASAETCAQCGADLNEGVARASAGRVVGAFKRGQAEAIRCPSCGTLNDGSNLECESCGSALPRGQKAAAASPAAGKAGGSNRNLLLIGGGVLLAICGLVYFLFLRTTEVQGRVTAVEWERSVVVEAFGDAEFEDWRDQIPSDAEILSCSQEERRVVSEEPSGGDYEEVCGTEYSVETGSGFAEVVQDCEYHVYEPYCSYLGDDWAPVATEMLRGNNLSPAWPNVSLASDERRGEEIESYVCVFDVDGEEYSYSTDSFQDFRQCEIGSVWTLSVNTLGAVTSIDQQ